MSLNWLVLLKPLICLLTVFLATIKVLALNIRLKIKINKIPGLGPLEPPPWGENIIPGKSYVHIIQAVKIIFKNLEEWYYSKIYYNDKRTQMSTDYSFHLQIDRGKYVQHFATTITNKCKYRPAASMSWLFCNQTWVKKYRLYLLLTVSEGVHLQYVIFTN